MDLIETNYHHVDICDLIPSAFFLAQLSHSMLMQSFPVKLHFYNDILHLLAMQFICDAPQAETSGGRWHYHKFGMSQMNCSNVRDEPMSKNTGQCSDLTVIQVDLIQMDD